MTNKSKNENETMTGFEDRLGMLDNDVGWQTPKVKASIDEFWGGKDTKKGDELKGIFLERREFEGRNNKPFISLIIQTAKGIYGVTENKYLESRLKTLKEGDGIYLKYTGTAPTKDRSNQYKTFEVKLMKFEPDPELGQDQGSPAGGILKHDDPMARNTLEYIKGQMTEKGEGNPESPGDVKNFLYKYQELEGFSDADISKMLKILAEEERSK
jgi:hypothetical protein